MKTPFRSFGLAVWDRVKRDFMEGFSVKARAIPETAITFAVTWWVLATFRNSDSVYDHAAVYLALPVAVVLFMILHVLWSWATAPRKIYNELKWDLHQYQVDSVPEIFYDREQHGRQDEEASFQNLKLGVRWRGAKPLKDVRLKIIKVQALGRHEQKLRQQRIDEVLHMSLQVEHRLGEDSQNIGSIAGVFDFVEIIDDPNQIRFYHTVRDANTKRVKDGHGRVPLGRYRVALQAEGTTANGVSVLSETKVVEFYTTKNNKFLKLKEVDTADAEDPTIED